MKRDFQVQEEYFHSMDWHTNNCRIKIKLNKYSIANEERFPISGGILPLNRLLYK